MHEYVFKLPGSLLSKKDLTFYKGDLGKLLEERQRKRSPKFTALRSDFLTLKKILTYINREYSELLEEIETIPETPLPLPKNIAEILFVTIKEPKLYQFPLKKNGH